MYSLINLTLLLLPRREAAVVWAAGEPFSIEEVLVDPPQRKEVRIKILYTSICHTDLSAWKGEVSAKIIS